MTHQVVVRANRRRGVGEVAGGAAADCAAVCCCCPCAVLNLVVLAVYKVPRGLVRKAAHKRRRRFPKNNVVLLQPQRSSSVDVSDIAVGQPHMFGSVTHSDIVMGPTRLEDILKNDPENEKGEEEVLEKEMWARFAGTGFWRSESQRQP